MRALEEAYISSDITPDDLDFLECHATGTPVGDKEERLAVHTFFGDSRVKQGKPLLPIGGSKAMTGHLLTGAGVVSTLSALLAINLRRVPPQVNFEQPPEDIDLQSLGLKVATRPELIHSEQVRGCLVIRVWWRQLPHGAVNARAERASATAGPVDRRFPPVRRPVERYHVPVLGTGSSASGNVACLP